MTCSCSRDCVCAREQAAYSLGLYILPWFAARFLSGELPGLFLMGRILYRCKTQPSQKSAFRAGAYCPGLLGISLGAEAEGALFLMGHIL